MGSTWLDTTMRAAFRANMGSVYFSSTTYFMVSGLIHQIAMVLPSRYYLDIRMSKSTTIRQSTQAALFSRTEHQIQDLCLRTIFRCITSTAYSEVTMV